MESYEMEPKWNTTSTKHFAAFPSAPLAIQFSVCVIIQRRVLQSRDANCGGLIRETENKDFLLS